MANWFERIDNAASVIRQLAEVGAPESDIDEYLASQKITGADLRQYAAVKESQKTGEKPGALARLGRGMLDITQGARELLPDAIGGYSPEQRGQINSDLALYEKGRAGDGIDWMRLGGQAVATAPLMAIPGGQTSALARIGAGAGAGALGGGLLYTGADSYGGGLASKGINAGIGGLLGGAVAGVAPAVVRGVGRAAVVGKELARRIGALFNDPKISARIQASVTEAAAREGVNLDDLGMAAKSALMKRAKESIDATGALDADALVRLARAESVGFSGDAAPLTGQVTRDPRVWGREQNLAKLEDIGDPLMARLRGQDANVESFFGLLGRRTDKTPYEMASVVRNSISKVDDAMRSGIREAYNAVPGGASLSRESLFDRTWQLLRQYEGSVPSGVKNTISDIVENKLRAFTFDDYVRLDKLINETMYDTDAGKAAAGALKKAMLGVIDDSAEASAAEAKPLYLQAKELAHKRFKAIGPDNGLVARFMREDISPEKVIKGIQSAPVDDVRRLMNFLDDSGREQVKQTMLDSMYYATLGKDAVSEAGLNNFLHGVPRENLVAVFGKDGAQRIDAFGKAVRDLYRAPARHTMNTSNTAITAADMVQSMYRGLIDDLVPGARLVTPLLRRGGADAAKQAQQQAIVELGLLGGVPKRAPLMSLPNPANVAIPYLGLSPAQAAAAISQPAGLLGIEGARR